MSELENKTVEKSPSELLHPKLDEVTFDFEKLGELIKKIDYKNFEDYNHGRVYQKNKELNILQSIIILLINEVKETNHNHTDATNVILSKVNKKLIVEQLSSLNLVFNHLNLDNKKIYHYLLGTIIQYIYEQDKKR